MKKLLIDDISHIEATGSYSIIHTKSGNHTLSINLKNFEKKLNDSTFLRVHRSYLVNTKLIDAINGNTIYIGESSIPIGPAQRSEVLKRLRVI